MFWHYVDDIFVVYQRHGDSASSKPWSTGTPWLLAFPRLSFIFLCEQLILLCVLLWDWDGAVCLHVSYFVLLHVWTAISSPDLIKASGACWDTRRIREFAFTSHGFITHRCNRHCQCKKCCKKVFLQIFKAALQSKLWFSSFSFSWSFWASLRGMIDLCAEFDNKSARWKSDFKKNVTYEIVLKPTLVQHSAYTQNRLYSQVGDNHVSSSYNLYIVEFWRRKWKRGHKRTLNVIFILLLHYFFTTLESYYVCLLWRWSLIRRNQKNSSKIQ